MHKEGNHSSDKERKKRRESKEKTKDGKKKRKATKNKRRIQRRKGGENTGIKQMTKKRKITKER